MGPPAGPADLPRPDRAWLFFSAFPLYYSVVVASHDNGVLGEVPPPLWLGGNLLGEHRAGLRHGADSTKALVNSFLVAGAITFSVVLFSTLAGFAFAKLRFRGRNVAAAADHRAP